MGAHKTKGKVLNVTPISALGVTPVAGLGYVAKVESIKRVEIGLSSVAVAMVDGTTNGSIGNQPLFTLPAKRIMILACSYSLPEASSAGLTATSTIKTAIGTVAAVTSDTLGTTQSNISAIVSTVQAANAATLAGPLTVAAPTPQIIDATAGTQQLFLNFGVADAGSTANATITITNGTVVVEYIELN